jgi:5-methylcytosine-specific restriction endonuclease McrA
VLARRNRTAKRNAYGVAKVKRSGYNTDNGFSTKSGWWDLSAAVRKRSGGKCEARIKGVRCGAPAVDVHHLIPLNSGGTNSLLNLLHICSACHSRRHNHLFRKRNET